MISKYTQNKITWIDIENPTKEEVRNIMNEYGLDPSVAEDLLDPTVKTRADIHSDFVYFVLHFPLHSHIKDKLFDKRSEEIDFVIGKDFVITVHYSSIEPLLSFGKSFETSTLLHNDSISENSGTLFVHILYEMYGVVQEKVEDIQTTLSSYEEYIFSGKEKEMVYKLSSMNRVLFYFEEALGAHKNTLDLFKKISVRMFGDEFKRYSEYILHAYHKANHAVLSAKDYSNELRETNNSLLSTKQNEVMKLLAIVSFITFPLTLISSILGMNTTHLPIVGHPYDFQIVIGLMISLGIGFFIFFKRKNWL
jgi:magnesium transporter